jgi:hypothetical protein
MDKKNVQKSTCRITFAQKRAALGNLRNFFGGIFMRACMVREHAPPLNPVCGGRCQKGGFVLHACPFLGDSYYRKKAFGVLGTVFGGHACPFLGESCFPIKWIAGFRGCRCGSFIVRLGPRSVIIAVIIAVKICP